MDRVIAIVVLLLGIAVGIAARNAWQDVARLDQTGVTTEATVIAMRETSGSRGGPSYYVTYELVAPLADGRSVVLREEHSVARERYDQSVVGGTIPVRYLPSDPRVNDVVGSDGGARGLSGFAALLIVASLAIWFDDRRRPRPWSQGSAPMPRLFRRRNSRISTESLRRLNREQRWRDRR